MNRHSCAMLVGAGAALITAGVLLILDLDLLGMPFLIAGGLIFGAALIEGGRK